MTSNDIPLSKPLIKLVVWDLDGTVWDGTLLEGGARALAPRVAEYIREFDKRGILNSIASRNDEKAALEQLANFDLAQYFVYPQIGWGAKSDAVKYIIEKLNIGADAVLFVDDSDFELAEVAFENPKIQVVNVSHLDEFVEGATMLNGIVTAESQKRRQMYIEDITRQDAERDFTGPGDEFMKSIDLQLACRLATLEDIDRAAELVSRTNQLNSTGAIYSREQLIDCLKDPGRRLLVASLKDRFGDYGTISVILLECEDDAWTINLILVSCRVLSRGIGPILLNYLASRALTAGRSLSVEFIDTGRNRPAKMALMMTNFVKVEHSRGNLYRQTGHAPQLPQWLTISSSW